MMDVEAIRDALAELREAVGWRKHARHVDHVLNVLDLRTDQMALELGRVCHALGVQTQLEVETERSQAKRLQHQENVAATQADVREVADRLDQALTDLRATLDALRERDGGGES
ncbi:hypothetical protein G1H11_11110 [Phytoactinopolyspora alkaliphila]|uniref:Uncharacterized protein n=1 Tax=Phytoactinopolyspora alkaliphila TaxID=1783498 RepID=A0A6N9YLR0_9ACTN|nr:hypothetical protein [Phytoactinopolyspora alkaliphila]NED95860.1 hypothetical protein [Phytoactinopolyspora alkaliphila]